MLGWSRWIVLSQTATPDPALTTPEGLASGISTMVSGMGLEAVVTILIALFVGALIIRRFRSAAM